MRGSTAFLAVLVTLSMSLAGNAAAEGDGQAGGFNSGRCIGDCGGDGLVTIDEIILSVRVALGEAAPEVCPVGGRGFTVNGVVSAVLNSLEGCTTLRDLSDFDEFAYALTPAFGFCPAVGAVHNAGIERRGDSHVLERSIIDTGTPGIDDCLVSHGSGFPCLVSRPVPCRLLTIDERERLREAFAQITVWTAADSFCLHGVEDPCLVRVARWDHLQTSDALCRASRLGREQSARLGAFVESLGDGPEIPCDGQ